MINLLPSQEKEEIKQEENFKLILILGIIFLFFLISFSLILTSINIYISGEAKVQKILYQQREKELENPQMRTFQEKLINFNQTLTQLESFYQGQPNFTEILEELTVTLPSGTYLTSLLITSQEKGEMLVFNLSGFSPTRQLLLDFKENLEKEDSFKEVSFPPANWVKPVDIDFTVNFKVK